MLRKKSRGAGSPAPWLRRCSVLRAPEEVVPGCAGRKVYQSQHRFEGGKSYLVRVIVDDRVSPALVITAYRTSRIAKYRRKAT